MPSRLRKQAKPNITKKRTIARKKAFLRAYRDTGSVIRSTGLAGVDRSTHYHWLAQDAEYKADCEMVNQMARDAVLDELVSRGLTAVFQPVIYKGEFQYTTRTRTLCTLAHSITVFEEELRSGDRVKQRWLVTTCEQNGYYKRDGRALCAAFKMIEKLEQARNLAELKRKLDDGSRQDPLAMLLERLHL